MQWDANRGRGTTASLPPLDPLDVLISDDELTVSVDGPSARFEFECPDRTTLLGMLSAVRYLLPLLLNIEFADPPVVVLTSGELAMLNSTGRLNGQRRHLTW